MSPSSPEAAPAPTLQDPALQSLTAQVHGRFATFRDRHPHSSLTAVLESGPAVNAAGITEYVVRATISLDGQPLVSSLAAAPTIEEAEDRARLRNLALAEAAVAGSDGAMAAASNASVSQAAPTAAAASIAAPSPRVIDPGDDGLGDTLINLGPLADAAAAGNPAPVASSKPKPKPKSKPKKAEAATPEPARPTGEVASSAPASATPNTERTSIEPETQATQEFVADWSEDLAQISVELKRLNWDNKQEQDYLQRTFNKASRDDIIDHSELMEYLGYLQALPSHFEETSEADDGPIADTGLSVDEADLAPQSVSELIVSAGLKSGADIPAPPPAVPPTVTEAEKPDAATASVDDVIIREPEPEIEIADDGPDDGPDDELNEELEVANESAPPLASLSRSEMMDETARLCKQLGWKNRQGSDFLKATYNKATRKDLTDAEMMDFLEQLRSLSTTEALPY